MGFGVNIYFAVVAAKHGSSRSPASPLRQLLQPIPGVLWEHLLWISGERECVKCRQFLVCKISGWRLVWLFLHSLLQFSRVMVALLKGNPQTSWAFNYWRYCFWIPWVFCVDMRGVIQLGRDRHSLNVWLANSIWLQDAEAAGGWWSNANAKKGLEENWAQPVYREEDISFGMAWSSGETRWGMGWTTNKFLSRK